MEIIEMFESSCQLTSTRFISQAETSSSLTSNVGNSVTSKQNELVSENWTKEKENWTKEKENWTKRIEKKPRKSIFLRLVGKRKSDVALIPTEGLFLRPIDIQIPGIFHGIFMEFFLQGDREFLRKISWKIPYSISSSSFTEGLFVKIK